MSLLLDDGVPLPISPSSQCRATVFTGLPVLLFFSACLDSRYGRFRRTPPSFNSSPSRVSPPSNFPLIVAFRRSSSRGVGQPALRFWIPFFRATSRTWIFTCMLLSPRVYGKKKTEVPRIPKSLVFCRLQAEQGDHLCSVSLQSLPGCARVESREIPVLIYLGYRRLFFPHVFYSMYFP